MTRFPCGVAVLAVCAVMSGCQPQHPVTPPAVLPISASPTDQWLGQWTGPEGTFLQLSKAGDAYRVTIHSLDGPNSYAGRAAGDHIEFVRGDKTESIRASNGVQTGMKWLADKTDCLTIQPGEGFCRK